MEMRCVWIICIVLLTIPIQKTTSVKLVVLRGDTADSASEEDSSDVLNEEESEEIDFLMDLIESEAKDNRNPPPVTTVRVIKQIAEHTGRPKSQRQVAQQSYRKERVQSNHPNSFKEYHVHYHNHHHRGPVRGPLMGFEDGANPFSWSSQQFPPLPEFEVLKQMQKSSLTTPPYSSRAKNFRDFDTLLRARLRSQFPHGHHKIDPKVRLEAFKDFDSFVKPRIPPMYKNKPESPYHRLKKFQEYYDSAEEERINNFDNNNKNRFAGFKDFSELENSDKSNSEDKGGEENPDENKTVKIKDFAIVIKSRPRKNHHVVQENNESGEDQDEEGPGGPQIPPFVNKLNIPNPFGMPRLLESPGGAPKYLDSLNQLRYPPPDFPFPMNFPLNPLDQRKLLHMRPPLLPPPFPMHHPLARYPLRPNINGWLLKRLLKKRR